ncbi:MAG: FAD-dependent oxidoreductase [Coriobacteriia bacterium]
MRTSRFLERVDLVEGVASFRFERPKGYAYEPGQYFDVRLEAVRDGRDVERFTISCAPGDAYLEFTTRLSGSAYKTALQALPEGGAVAVSDAAGRLVVPPGELETGFLLGGIGITPARSILRDAAQRGTGLSATLFYGSRDASSVAFRNELDAYETGGAGVRVVHVLAAPSPGWAGETGFITAEMVRRHVNDPSRLWWAVSGPPAMVAAMRTVLDDLRVPPDRAAFEFFAGY